MNEKQFLKNLSVPNETVDVVIDTDTYNEIDDQFAVSYLIRSNEKLITKAIYAAPFFNELSSGPLDGMEKSYNEIQRLLKFLNRTDIPSFKGSQDYLKDEKTPVISDAANDLIERAKNYSPKKPLYVVAIGAITNIASALIIEPAIKDNIVVVWLGGHAHHFCDTKEFNLEQDIAAARVVMQSGAPFVQLPCIGVVSEFRISKQELEHFLKGKNEISDYLANTAISAADSYAKGTDWTRVLWDVTAVAWLLNDNDKFMLSKIINTILPDYNGNYEKDCIAIQSSYIYYIKRDELMNDLIKKLTKA